MSDWGAVGVASGWDEGTRLADRLEVENEDLGRRLQRLAPLLSEMARDLAATRKENAALKREVSRLRGLVDAAPPSPTETPSQTAIGSGWSERYVEERTHLIEIRRELDDYDGGLLSRRIVDLAREGTRWLVLSCPESMRNAPEGEPPRRDARERGGGHRWPTSTATPAASASTATS